MRAFKTLQLSLAIIHSIQAGFSDAASTFDYGDSVVDIARSDVATTSILSTSVLSADIFPTSTPQWWLSDDEVRSRKRDLPQHMQNGHSSLGSLQAPRYSAFVGASRFTRRSPWGTRTARSTDPYQDVPNTGVTRFYNFTIARATLAPDGVEKSVILVNGECPGPTIEANWGDTIQVTVFNNITGPDEGTSLHWHGFLLRDTPYFDGVPGVTQCPIAPGQTFTYSIKAELYGTSWYHTHYSAQYTAGAFGAMIIHGPSDNAHYDADLGPVILSDYYHDNYFDLVEQTMGTDASKVRVVSDNNLINGKGIYNCTFAANPQTCNPNAGLSKFSFTSGKSYRLRLINAGGEGLQKFSIDGHTLNVIAYDFVPIVPYQTHIVTLGVGQRADVIVTATGNSNEIVFMRSTLSNCSSTRQPNALAMIYYEQADTNGVSNSVAWPDNTDPCANDALSTTVPYYQITPTSTPDTEIEIDISIGTNATGHYVWSMNNSTFRTDFSNPMLPLAQAGVSSTTFPSEWNVYDVADSKSIRITLNNLTPASHPMHIHGHNMYVLSSTSTIPSTPVPLNSISNPTRRDTQILAGNGQIVLQIDGGNPGAWPLHCHIAWHVSAGLYVNILENKHALQNMTTPPSVTAVCNSWAVFTGKEVVDQIDSGL